MRSTGSFLLSFPEDLSEKVISRLQMFILMSDVQIEDISNSFSQIGLINEKIQDAYLFNENLSL